MFNAYCFWLWEERITLRPISTISTHISHKLFFVRVSEYSSINSRFSISDISLSASTSIPDLSSCSSTSTKSQFSRNTYSSSQSLSLSSLTTNLSTMTVPVTWAPEKPPRRHQPCLVEDKAHVICIKISQEPETELECVNIRDAGGLSPTPGTPSPPPPPSLTWSSLHSTDHEFPPPPSILESEISLLQEEDVTKVDAVADDSSWDREIQFAIPANIREDEDLGKFTSLSYEGEYEALNEVGEYDSKSLNRKVIARGNCQEIHHLLKKLDDLETRKRELFLEIIEY